MRTEFFVAMDYGSGRRSDLERAIDEASRGLGFKRVMADRKIESKALPQTLIDDIHATEFGLYDITEANKTVLFELGVAMGIAKVTGNSKKYYILCGPGKSPDLPPMFTTQHGIHYENYTDLRKKLRELARPAAGSARHGRCRWPTAGRRTCPGGSP